MHDVTAKTSLRPLGLLVIAYVTLAVFIAPEVYPRVLIGYLGLLVKRGVLILLPILLVAGVLGDPHSPTKHAISIVKSRWRSAGIVAVVFFLGTAAFTTIKLSIPDINPFYADPYLDTLDRWLHGGAPWEVTHALLPDWAEFVLGYIYGGVWMAMWLGVFGFVAFWSNNAVRARYLWAHALTIGLLGTVLAVIFSSYGPIFYDRFGDSNAYDALLMSLDRSEMGSAIREIANYLYVSGMQNGATIGTGISAMPSMHVGIATLNACMLWGRNIWLGVFGWAFVTVILLGSVHFGWHYAVDGYVSLVLVIAIWHFSAMFVPQSYKKL